MVQGGYIPEETGIRAHALNGAQVDAKSPGAHTEATVPDGLAALGLRAALYFLALLMRREHFELSQPYNLVSLAHEQHQHTVERNSKREWAVVLNKNLNLRVCSAEQETLAVLFPGIAWVMFENNG